MIKSIKYLSIIALSLLFIYKADIALAQNEYSLIKFDADFPMKLVPRNLQYGSRARIGIDTILRTLIPEFFSRKRIQDTLFFEFKSLSAAIPVAWTVQFVLDTINQQLKDVYAQFKHGWSSSGGQYPYTYNEIYDEEASVLYSSLSYQLVGSNLLVITDTGYHCKERIRQVHYQLIKSIEGHFDPSNPPESIYDISSALIDGSSGFQCSIVLSIAMLSVDQETSPNSSGQLLAEHSIDVDKILFRFPKTEHSERLIIYDVLGRSIAEFEVFPGAEEYSISASTFQRGQYFARLGNLTTHF